MIPLAAAIIVSLHDQVPGLGGRVYDGAEPLNDWQCPLAVVAAIDWEHEPTIGDEGFERATVRVRVTDELHTSPSVRVEVAQRVNDVLTGRDPTVPALDDVRADDGLPVLAGWLVGAVTRLGSKDYPQALEGHRYMHTA